MPHVFYAAARPRNSSSWRAATGSGSGSEAETDVEAPNVPSAARKQTKKRRVERLDRRDAGGRLPLQRAASRGDATRVRELLSAGSSPEDRDYAGTTALHSAALRGDAAVVKALVEAGALVDVRSGPDELDTPLMDAVSSGHVEVVRLLIDAGADARICNLEGRDALGFLPDDDDKETQELEQLLGESILAAQRSGRPLIDQSEGAPVGLFPPSDCDTTSRQRLLSTLDISSSKCREEVARCAAKGDLAVVGHALEQGWPPTAEALVLAAKFGRHEIVGLLLALGLGVDAEWEGETAVAAVLGRGHIETLQLLLDSGARRDWHDSRGRSYSDIVANFPSSSAERAIILGLPYSKKPEEQPEVKNTEEPMELDESKESEKSAQSEQPEQLKKFEQSEESRNVKLESVAANPHSDSNSDLPSQTQAASLSPSQSQPQLHPEPRHILSAPKVNSKGPNTKSALAQARLPQNTKPQAQSCERDSSVKSAAISSPEPGLGPGFHERSTRQKKPQAMAAEVGNTPSPRDRENINSPASPRTMSPRTISPKVGSPAAGSLAKASCANLTLETEVSAKVAQQEYGAKMRAAQEAQAQREELSRRREKERREREARMLASLESQRLKRASRPTLSTLEALPESEPVVDTPTSGSSVVVTPTPSDTASTSAAQTNSNIAGTNVAVDSGSTMIAAVAAAADPSVGDLARQPAGSTADPTLPIGSPSSVAPSASEFSFVAASTVGEENSSLLTTERMVSPFSIIQATGNSGKSPEVSVAKLPSALRRLAYNRAPQTTGPLLIWREDGDEIEWVLDAQVSLCLGNPQLWKCPEASKWHYKPVAEVSRPRVYTLARTWLAPNGAEDEDRMRSLRLSWIRWPDIEPLVRRVKPDVATCRVSPPSQIATSLASQTTSMSMVSHLPWRLAVKARLQQPQNAW